MGKTSILIVDDEESIRVSLESILKKENYDVKSSSNALTARSCRLHCKTMF